jgi:hypothetical protein
MKKLTVVFATAACLAISCLGFSQSSGNFSYGTSPQNETACVMDSGGTITGGETCEMNCTIDALGNSTCTTQSGTCGGNILAGIKTSSGAGNVFVIRPSAVIGLLTDVTVSSKQAGSATGTVSSSALAGAAFTVTVTPESGQAAPTVIPSYGVTYDSRYIQISTNLFQALAATCLTIDGGCFITFNESTVSAHSFDWIATGLAAGNYGVTVNWQDTLGGSGISRSLTCVGPVNVTVQQNKVFTFNRINSL